MSQKYLIQCLFVRPSTPYYAGVWPESDKWVAKKEEAFFLTYSEAVSILTKLKAYDRLLGMQIKYRIIKLSRTIDDE